MKFLKRIKKFLKWIWYGKSITSYVAFIILAYLFLKFLVYPAFLLATGLKDITTVLSGSMRHDPELTNKTFYRWLEFYNYSKEDYEKWPFLDGLYMGDAVAIGDKNNITVGDVIVFINPSGKQIIHRVVNITVIDGEKYYSTKGDANPTQLYYEIEIPEERVIGKVVARIPFIGIPRLLLYYLTGI